MTAPPAPSCPTPKPTPSTSPTPPEPDRNRASPSLTSRLLGGSTLLTLALVTIVIAGLHIGRGALLPITLAALVAFLLAPFVTRLRRAGVPNTAAVITVCTLAGLVVAGLGVVVVRQAVDLADSLPQYHANVSAKLQHLRTNPNGTIARLRNMFNSLADEWSTPDRPPPEPKWWPDFFTGDEDSDEQPTTAPVTVTTSNTDTLDLAATAAWILIDIAVTIGIIAVLALFILLALDDIRSRIVQLFGNRPGQLYLSTQVLEEAGERVSRYLLMLLIVNVTYGVPIGLGLYFIGIPNAALWGVLAIVLRFIPYIGPWIAAAFPVLLSIAISPGWDTFLWTVGLFIVIELISNNLVEPYLYGHSTGVSPLGVLLSAVFWALLWGPIGLLLATPLTICLVVLGRYIPAMRFFPLLLGDQVELPLHARIYQRLLALDPDEPDELAQEYLEDNEPEAFYERVMLPMLRLLDEEHHHCAISDDRRAFVLEQSRSLIEDALDVSAPPEPDDAKRVLIVPAHRESEELVGMMIQRLLWQRGVAAELLRATTFSPERNARLAGIDEEVVCISSLPPVATAHTIQTARRIRRGNGDVPIVVGYFDEAAPKSIDARLEREKPIKLVHTISAALKQLPLGNVPIEEPPATTPTASTPVPA